MKTKRHPRAASVLLSALLAAGAVPGARAQEAATAAAEDKPQPAAAANETNTAEVLVRPGLTADRARRVVRIEASATGMEAGQPMEFFVIGPKSGHDYEAYVVSHARPSDVHRALAYIGLRPGHPVDPRHLVFWPKGPRVIMHFETSTPFKGEGDTPLAEPRRFRAEETILDLRTQKTLPAEGLVFVGSVQIADGELLHRAGYAADLIEPHAIATAFNLETTVLDIPRLGSRGERYDYQVLNPERALPAGAPVTITLEPEDWRGGRGRVLDVLLRVGPEIDDPSKTLLTAALVGGDVLCAGGPPELAEALAAQSREGYEVYVDVRPSPELTVAAMGSLARELEQLVQQHNIRIEPPSDGHLYYQAFLPDPRFRDREQRPSQPWEIHLRRKGNAVEARLVKLEPQPDATTAQTVLKTTEFVAATPADVGAIVSKEGAGLPVLIVFTPADLPYGTVLTYLRPLRESHPVVFVYPEEEE